MVQQVSSPLPIQSVWSQSVKQRNNVIPVLLRIGCQAQVSSVNLFGSWQEQDLESFRPVVDVSGGRFAIDPRRGPSGGSVQRCRAEPLAEDRHGREDRGASIAAAIGDAVVFGASVGRCHKAIQKQWINEQRTTRDPHRTKAAVRFYRRRQAAQHIRSAAEEYRYVERHEISDKAILRPVVGDDNHGIEPQRIRRAANSPFQNRLTAEPPCRSRPRRIRAEASLDNSEVIEHPSTPARSG